MTLPPQPFGFVAGRWVLSIGDTPDDPDRAPDYIPVPKGRITFTPALSHRVVPDPTTHPDGWAGIIKRPVVGTLGPQGQLIDGEGHDFIALPLGTYSVSYDFEGTPWPSHYLEVTAESTVDAPLWLPTKSPLPTGPGVVQVVSEATRIAAEAAAARAETSAILAGDHADSAEASALIAAAASSERGLRVDTSVGTRVMLDHPNGTLMLSGDTGWRTISSWTSTGELTGTAHTNITATPGVAGNIQIRRENRVVTVAMRGLTLKNSAVLNLPEGFQALAPYLDWPVTLPDRTIRVSVGFAQAYFPTNMADATLGTQYGTVLRFRTDRNWPTALPGLPTT